MTFPENAVDGRGTGETGAAPVEASPPVPTAPDGAAVAFGDRLEVAEHFAAILADTAVSHGLIGPREVPILWERHVLNCAVAQLAFPQGVEIIDVGSGAGLPGLALAIARPDLRLHLVEPMLRRTNWLGATIAELGLDNVEVHRGRAEEFRGELVARYATARAVARIDKLARWTFPLLEDGGTLVALKGSQAAQELAAEEQVLRSLGMREARIGTYGADVLEVPTVTIELTVGPATSSRRTARPTVPRRGAASPRSPRRP
jgi:16S rRNA (guanine527-N7)-methyltransferase